MTDLQSSQPTQVKARGCMNLGERAQEKKMSLWALELRGLFKDVARRTATRNSKKKKGYYTKENVITVYCLSL